MRSKWGVLGFTVVLLATLDAGAGKKGTWHVPGDFATIQAAIDDPSVQEGDTIIVAKGTHAGATVTKGVEIRAAGLAVIDDGPILFSGHPLGGDLKIGFFFPSGGGGDGAVIRGFRFEDLAFGVFSRGADGVTVTSCTLDAPVQGITNWGGDGWTITHNEIVDLRSINGGGIGILAGDFLGRTADDSLIAHNRISGTLHVHPLDGGGYNGTGIVLYADYRGGRLGASSISGNQIVHNDIALESDTPAVVDVVAIELTDTGVPLSHDASDTVVAGNAIGFNDLRGTVLQFAFTDGAEDANEIGRNLGDNRGDGVFPGPFVPGKP